MTDDQKEREMTDPEKIETVPPADAPLIFVRRESSAARVLCQHAGKIIPGVILLVSEEELRSLRDGNDMLVLWKG